MMAKFWMMAVFVLCLALPPARAAVETTFLDTWLITETPMSLGRKHLVNAKTNEELELFWYSPTPDKYIKGYCNKKTGEMIIGRKKGAINDTLLVRMLNDEQARVNLAEYTVVDLFEATDTENKTHYLVQGDYKERKNVVDLRDTLVFLPISGEIQYSAVVRAFEGGAKELALMRPPIVVVTVDTPGGRIDFSDRLCAAIAVMRRAEIRVYAYINGDMKAAYSAGSMVSMACEKIVMAPGSVIGAAIPITGEGKDIEGDLGKKRVSGFAAKLRALAEQCGFPPALAAAMADKELGAVELIAGDKHVVVNQSEAPERKKQLEEETKGKVEEKALARAGTPATISAEEAMRLGGIVGIAETPAQLLALLPVKTTKMAIYDPVDKFWRRIKPVNDQILAINRKIDAANVAWGMANSAGQAIMEISKIIKAYDEALAIMAQHPEIYDDEDIEELKTRRERLNAQRLQLSK